MNSALWIALAAGVLVVVAHIVLFWWFLCKGRKPDSRPPEEPRTPENKKS